ncbi:Na+/H+ antiporter NhaA [Thermogemmatispora carboxidivorans]|uniref:Na+/H+ antiporter NhaA n=1 Tax=Thermogemmatispora carboxidivorans TaxID=1382306 RepID=UPI000AB02BBB|nr:Na+/H+ antiporter NhaA [Thermogemmatispora carboxidivorans]
MRNLWHRQGAEDQRSLVRRLPLLPFQEFAQTETASGFLLVSALLLGFLWANSPWSASYFHLLEIPLTVGVAGTQLDYPLHTWINDGLMTIFFLLVGLELKREILVGELSTPRQAALPVLAAISGATCPAVIYLLWNAGSPAARGWGIPMATDIALALAVLSLMSRRLPPALKVFLSALAIADDLIAVLVIAIFYTQGLNWVALAIAGGVAGGLFLLGRLGWRRLWPYTLLGLVLWLAFFLSGVHASIAGVVLAFLMPARAQLDLPAFMAQTQELLAQGSREVVGASPQWFLDQRQQSLIHALELVCKDVQAPLQRMEHLLQRWVPFVIIPLFALVNAGVRLEGSLAQLLSPVSLGVALGLLLGKPIGIVSASWLASRLGLVQLPEGVRFRHLPGLGTLAGIGFTMSLFIANLAFEETQALALTQAKLAILVSGVMASSLGALLLRLSGTTHPSQASSPATTEAKATR